MAKAKKRAVSCRSCDKLKARVKQQEWHIAYLNRVIQVWKGRLAAAKRPESNL